MSTESFLEKPEIKKIISELEERFKQDFPNHIRKLIEYERQFGPNALELDRQIGPYEVRIFIGSEIQKAIEEMNKTGITL